MTKPIVIGSRGSDLALWQANFVKDELKKIGQEVEIKIIKTQGDAIQHLSFDKMEGKGFFTKEIEEALLNKQIDLAVHSHKDLETTSPVGLKIAAVSYREDPSDILLVHKNAIDSQKPLSLKHGAVVGTSSARRKAQLLSIRNDFIIKDIRGNVPTRINKLREEQFDAIMLAHAGVKRLQLDLSEFEVVALSPDEFIPAPAQGILALQIREADTTLASILEKLNHAEVAKCAQLERKVLNLFQGGCQLPLGVYVQFVGGNSNYCELWAAMAETWDAPVKRVYFNEPYDMQLAEKAVEALKKK